MNCVETVIGNEISSDKIKEAIKDYNTRKELRKCYKVLSKKLKGDLNNTSLIVLHGPAFKGKDVYVDIEANICLNFYFRYPNIYCPSIPAFWIETPWVHRFKILSKHFTQFLTGDINLNYRRKQKPKYNGLKAIEHHFKLGSLVKKLFAILIPHHGSKESWNEKLCKLVSSYIWLVSAGIVNEYGHPSWKVFKDILFTGWNKCIF